ncbi:unnamed protein product, partial [Timema podura]|nr:unnamed protein product [Timema podura]
VGGGLSHPLRLPAGTPISHTLRPLVLHPVPDPISFSVVKMSEDDQYSLPNDYPIVELECQVAFDALSNKQKLYAHYLSLASWHGSLAVYLQITVRTHQEATKAVESISLAFDSDSLSQAFDSDSISQAFDSDSINVARVTSNLQSPHQGAILTNQLMNSRKQHSSKVSQKKISRYGQLKAAECEYLSVFFSNSGNYKGFGDTKFVPNLPVDQLEVLLKASKAWNSEPETLQSLWDRVKGPLYSLSEREKQLSYPDKIRLAAVETSPDVIPEADFKGSKFVVTKGDYSPIMKLLVQHLGKAKEHAANDFEKKMLDHYQTSFTTGSLDAHKDGSRQWIKNKDPIIETPLLQQKRVKHKTDYGSVAILDIIAKMHGYYWETVLSFSRFCVINHPSSLFMSHRYIGFIETYRDPAGSRGEFEGFVAMVNKPMSEKFNTLVNKAESLLTRLPWTKDFEKDTFLQPDFTSLDVLSFSGSGIPAGINIPNYDEIRQNEGFKNVSLGNVIPAAYKDAKTPFLTQEDSNILEKLRIPAFELHKEIFFISVLEPSSIHQLFNRWP